MRLAIFGASGFAREVEDIALFLGYQEIVFIDREENLHWVGKSIVSEKRISHLKELGYKFIIGIGSPKIRQEIACRYPQLEYTNLIHPSTTFGHGQLEALRKKVGNIVFPGARPVGLGIENQPRAAGDPAHPRDQPGVVSDRRPVRVVEPVEPRGGKHDDEVVAEPAPVDPAQVLGARWKLPGGADLARYVENRFLDDLRLECDGAACDEPAVSASIP